MKIDILDSLQQRRFVAYSCDHVLPEPADPLLAWGPCPSCRRITPEPVTPHPDNTGG